MPEPVKDFGKSYKEPGPWYHLFFIKSFSHFALQGDLRLHIQSSTNMEFALNRAREMNKDPFINIQVEHFAIYESEKGKPGKKGMKKIYPGQDHSLY